MKLEHKLSTMSSKSSFGERKPKEWRLGGYKNNCFAMNRELVVQVDASETESVNKVYLNFVRSPVFPLLYNILLNYLVNCNEEY